MDDVLICPKITKALFRSPQTMRIKVKQRSFCNLFYTSLHCKWGPPCCLLFRVLSKLCNFVNPFFFESFWEVIPSQVESSCSEQCLKVVKVFRRSERWGSQLLWVISDNFLFLGIFVFLFFLNLESFVFGTLGPIWEVAFLAWFLPFSAFFESEIRVLFLKSYHQCPCSQNRKVLSLSVKRKVKNPN